MRIRTTPWMLILLPLTLAAEPKLPLSKPLLKTPQVTLPGSAASNKKKTPDKSSPVLQKANAGAGRLPGAKSVPDRRIPASALPRLPTRIAPLLPAGPARAIPSLQGGEAGRGSMKPAPATTGKTPGGGGFVPRPGGSGGFSPVPGSTGSAIPGGAGKGGFVPGGSKAKADVPTPGTGFAPDKPASDKSAGMAGAVVPTPGGVGRSNQPEHDTEAGTFVWGDGTRTPDTGPGGSPAKVNEKGDVSYADGTTVVNNGSRGVTVHRPDGTSRSYEADQNGAWQPAGTSNQPEHDKEAGTFVWGDGTRTPDTGPGGSPAKVNEKGDVSYDDGTTVANNGSRGVTVHRPDGTSRSYEADQNGAWQPAGTSNQPEHDKEAGAFVWGDGARVRATGPDGSMGKVNEKGDITYTDGTMVVHGDDGSLTVHKPDGSSRTHTRNEDGSWGGSGSGGDSGDDSGGRSGGSGSDDSSGSSDDDSGSGDSDSKDSNDSDSGSDSDAESGSKDTKETTDEKTEEGGSDKQDYGDGSYRDGPSATVQVIVDRASGKRREPESSRPGDCKEGGMGAGVSQPGPGGQGNCLPAGTPGIEPDEQSGPDAGEAATNVDRRNRSRGDVRGRVTQPGVDDFSGPGSDLRTFNPFDRNPVTNPGEPR